ncbi:MAG: hypothetical protein K0Q68_779 [Moraxellaceae bacterium]|jgi:uncharacterized protein (TIGR01777 family)|nr:hypothetical protein [Moraxellaceae bacterium]
MDIHLTALALMAAQGCLGAFDTLYHHELTEALAQRPGARRELAIHAARALIYGVLFIGLSAWAWHGAWAVVLMLLFAVEIVLTLWDFVIEDRSRLLPATERVTHTVLAINGGAFITLLALAALDWQARPTALAWQPQGLLSIFLMLCGIGVAASGVRDALAARALGRRAAQESARVPLRFDATPRRVLVTGGTGFIGQELVQALLADGHDVTVLTRDSRRAAWNFAGRVRCLDNLDALPASAPVDVIINLAGARILGPRWTPRRQAELRESRLGITRQLVDWIARAERKPALLLSASAIGFYGIQAQGDTRVLDESAGPQNIFMSTLCQEWEAAARSAEVHGVRVVGTRFGLVLGHQGALPAMLLPVWMGLGGRMGSGRQWLSWIHVRDLLRALAHVWQQEWPAAIDPPSPARAHESPTVPATATVMKMERATGPAPFPTGNACPPGAATYNFTAPEALSQHDFSRTAAAVLHRPCVLPTPGKPVRCLLGEQADLLLEGQRVAPAALLASGFHFEFPTLRAALLDLCRPGTRAADAPAIH